MSTGNFAKQNVKQFFKSVDCTNIFYCCNKQWRHWKGYRWHPEGHQEESYLRFVTYSATCVAKKENQNRGPQIILPPCPKKCLNFSQLLLFLLVGLAKPLQSLAPVQPLTMAYKYRRLVLLVKLPEKVFDSQTKRVGE